MDQLFHQSNVEMQQMHVYLQQLEQSVNESEAQPLFQIIYQKMEKFNEVLIELDRLVSKEPPTRKRTARYIYSFSNIYLCISISFV